MITRKCNADKILNTTDCVAVASQAAYVYSRFNNCFNLLLLMLQFRPDSY